MNNTRIFHLKNVIQRILPFLIVLFPVATFWGTEPLIVKKTISKNTASFILPQKFYDNGVVDDYTISFPKEINIHTLPPSIVDIPFIMNVISLVWFSGEDYTIDEMDEDLYYSLEKVKEFHKRYHCNTQWNGRLIPKRLIKNHPPTPSTRPAMLFSSGVDSTATLFRHWDENPILITFGTPCQEMKTFIKKHGFTHYSIQSNYLTFTERSSPHLLTNDITTWHNDAVGGLSWIGMTVPILYAKGIPLLYVASSLTWKEFLYKDGKTTQSGTMNPIVDENLSPAGIRVIHDAFDLARAEKLAFISSFVQKHHLKKPTLLVCFGSTKRNCGRCEKCLRTINACLAIGENPQEFGLSRYPMERLKKQLIHFFSTHSFKGRMVYCYHRQIQQTMEKNRESLPLTHRAYYDWFISLNLWEKTRERTRLEPITPFSWDQFYDLYENIPNLDFEGYP